MSRIQDVIKDTKSKKSTHAKQTLVLFAQKIDKELDKYFNRELESVFGVSKEEKRLNKLVLDHIQEHNLRPAKRLRASLAYYSYKMLGGKNERTAIEAAMSVELVHTALLMHDDFMDQDDTRRGKPTTHKYFEAIHKANNYRFDGPHYGNTMAVNAGDVALCMGYEILVRTKAGPRKINEALARFLRGIVNTAYGQSYDVTLESRGIAKESDVINLHHAKTAIYTYENPIHIGAILAGVKNSDLSILSSYAIPAGVAFQLQDDILGLFGNPIKTGKPAHSDLRQGKMTLLIIKALEQASKEQKKNIIRIWGNRNITQKDADLIRKIVVDTGSLDYSRKVSVKYAKKAQLAIPKMIKKGWNKEAIDYLDGIAQYMVERNV